MMNRQACQHAGSLDHFDAGVHCDHMKAVLEKMETISSGATTCIQDQSAGLEQGLKAAVKAVHVQRQGGFNEVIGKSVVIVYRHGRATSSASY